MSKLQENSENGKQSEGLSILETLSPRFSKSLDWQDELYKQGCYRALDIPLSPGIHAPKITNNYGGLKSLIAGAILASGIGLGGLVLGKYLTSEAEVIEKVKETVYDSDIEMEIIPPE